MTLNNPDFSAHQSLPADADPNDPASDTRFTGQDYAPDLISKAARDFLRENKDGPFFLYYPTTVPHLALQVPEDSLAEYTASLPDEPYLGNDGYLPHRTPRAAYAAMITRLDREIGRLLALVDEFGLRENTIVVFTSDNGPLSGRFGGTDTEFFDSTGGLRGRKNHYYEAGNRERRLATPTVHERGLEFWPIVTLAAFNFREVRNQVPAGSAEKLSDGLTLGFETKAGTALATRQRRQSSSALQT